MTTPRGYPDYQNYPQWRGTVIFAGNTTINSVTTFTRAFYVAQFTALQVFVNNVTGNTGVLVTFQWFTDSTQTVSQGSYSANLFHLQTLAATIPNLGNFCLVTISTPNVGNVSVNISIQPVNIPVAKPQYQVVSNQTIVHNLSVGAGATVQFFLPFVAEGNGQVLVVSANAGISYNVFVEQIDQGGNALGELFIGNALTTPLNTTFQSAAQCVRFSVTNNNAAAQVFNFKCSVLPA